MQNILIIGDENRAQIIRKAIPESLFQVDISDGDSEEDFKDYDIIFDVNCDDDSENFPIYTQMRDKLIFLSTVKQTLSELAYIYPSKVRSRLYGINSLAHYLHSDVWEISCYRASDTSYADDFLKQIKKQYILVDDSVGMYRPRVEFLAINERVQLLEEGKLPQGITHPYLEKEFKRMDEIGVTDIFESLMAMYEDTKDMKYQPTSLLKKKYLRNHRFVKS